VKWEPPVIKEKIPGASTTFNANGAAPVKGRRRDSTRFEPNRNRYLIGTVAIVWRMRLAIL